MNKVVIIVIFLICTIFSANSQKFTQKVSFNKFDTYAKSLNSIGLQYVFSELKGDSVKGNINYSSMLINGNGSVTLKMMDISEFSKGASKLADVNTGVYEKYKHKLVFWALLKAKQGFLYIELPQLDAMLILGMQPEYNQESLEQMMLKIDCLNYFNLK